MLTVRRRRIRYSLFQSFFLDLTERSRPEAALISKLCESAKVSIKELKSGNRRKEVSSVRYLIAVGLVRNHGVSFAEVARRVGVSTTAEGKRGIFEFDIFLIWIRIRS